MARHIPLLGVVILLVTNSANALWDSALTDALLSSQNAKLAEKAQDEGKEHWTETGIGVTADGSVQIQAIAKGVPFEHIKAGLFLVASPGPQDSIFSQSVVLLLRHDANGTLGVIVNKPAQLKSDEHLEPSEVRNTAWPPRLYN